MIDRMMPYLPAAIAVLLVVAFYSFAIAPYDLEVTENNFSLFDGHGAPLKAVLISDTETTYDYPNYLDGAVALVNAQQPDIVFLAGDYVELDDGAWEKLGPLGNIRAKYGVYAVLGNHDYREWGCSRANASYADKVAAKLESMGITVLRNDYRIIDAAGHRVAIVGIDDYWACRNDFRKAEQGISPAVPQIILAHNPVAFYGEELPAGALLLSGHTHCGQVRLPMVTDAITRVLGLGDTVGGRAKLGQHDMYITCGVIPGGVRFLTRPEISVLYVD
ncbi:MAG: metallophosphoesterase [Candidatus ainarchaeum sp.]|nr:metallophosphoesterase [Candidatus ainarchaeum sp.]